MYKLRLPAILSIGHLPGVALAGPRRRIEGPTRFASSNLVPPHQPFMLPDLRGSMPGLIAD